MRKLRVGVWVHENYKPEMGGGFGYYTQLINTLYDYKFNDAEIIFVSFKFSDDWNKKDSSYEIKTQRLEIPTLTLKSRILNKVLRELKIRTKNQGHESQESLYNDLLKTELNAVVDVMYYVTPGCSIENFPYIYSLWDIGHLSMYAFPEVSMNNVFEQRKQHHDTIPSKALMVFCESKKGKQDAVKYLMINEDRIKIVPIFPSEIINDVLEPIKPSELKNEFFIHYPAQFWSHKNHYNLLLALKSVIIEYPDLKLILTGSDKGNKKYILDLVSKLNLSDSVIDLGFVPMEELKWIYKYSQGLVMPTFLGPTNMPLLEAAELGCPVACSNLEGHIEQLGNYAYYFDPKNPVEISQSIIKMITDNQSGVDKIYNSTFNIDRAIVQIDKAFSELKSIRFCWGENDKIF